MGEKMIFNAEKRYFIWEYDEDEWRKDQEKFQQHLDAGHCARTYMSTFSMGVTEVSKEEYYKSDKQGYTLNSAQPQCECKNCQKGS